MATIGATVLEENKYVVPGDPIYLGAANIFTDGCDESEKFYISEDNFSGKAFILDLKAKYRISHFRMRNTHNSNFNNK